MGTRRISLLQMTATGLVALACASAAPGTVGAQSLLERCFAPADLAARDGEKTPRRGAAGQYQSIPQIELAAPVPIPASLRGAVRRVDLPKGKKLISLTLDMCEQAGEIAGYDGAILDLLRRHKVKATVFAGGKWMMSHGERTWQLLADPLLEIGNHGWAHRNVRSLAAPALADEIRGPQASYALRRAQLETKQCTSDAALAMSRVPKRLTLYRFPFGACNAEALAAVNAEGMLAIQWDISTGDSSKSESARAIADEIVGRARPGSIILAHANGRGYHTAEGLEIAIPKLKAMGYELVSVSELIAAGKPVVAGTCYDARPGDTDKYDKLFATARTVQRSRDKGQAEPLSR